MDALFEARTITYAQAARFVLVTAETINENSALLSACDLAREKGWLPREAAPDSPITTGELCFLIMNAFNMEGSFLYDLFPGPRYAFRELDYLKLIPGQRDPSAPVAGDQFLRILGLVLNHTGETLISAETPAETAPEEPPVKISEEVQTRRLEVAREIRAELLQAAVADTDVRVVEAGVTISLNNIQFLADSVQLTENEKLKVRELAGILSRYPNRKILVEGHTALAGNEAGRQQVSEERARAVADFLVDFGLRKPEDISVRGYGAQRPLADNATAEGQALNRRVEITLMDE
ncbi:MAG: OmpA family protein [Spirochaetales bacterium]|nr:OmpA family protein [Spirochaetales bacterium]